MFDFKRLFCVLFTLFLLICQPLHASDEKIKILGEPVGGFSFNWKVSSSALVHLSSLANKGYKVYDSRIPDTYTLVGPYMGVDSLIDIMTKPNTDKVVKIRVTALVSQKSKDIVNAYNKFCKGLMKQVSNGLLIPLFDNKGCQAIKTNTNISKYDALIEFKYMFGQQPDIAQLAYLEKMLKRHWRETNANFYPSVKSSITAFAVISLKDVHRKLYPVSLDILRVDNNNFVVLTFYNLES